MLVDYEKGSNGINVHFDGQTKFDPDMDIKIITVNGVKYIRMAPGVRAKNPLFYVYLAESSVFIMKHHTVGTCYFKHGFTAKDVVGNVQSFVLRRIRPSWLLFSKQCGVFD